MVHKKTISSSVQLLLFPCQETSIKNERNGNRSVAKYLTTREALWRLLASYPQRMPLTEAIRRAHIDFTRAGKEVTA